MDEMLSPETAAKILGMRPGTIRMWLRTGKLDGIKVGTAWRVRMNEVNRLLSDGGSPSPRLDRIPEILLRMRLADGRSVTFVESTAGLLLVAVNGKPRATVKLNELPAMIRATIQSSGSSTAVVDLAVGE